MQDAIARWAPLAFRPPPLCGGDPGEPVASVVLAAVVLLYGAGLYRLAIRRPGGGQPARGPLLCILHAPLLSGIVAAVPAAVSASAGRWSLAMPAAGFMAGLAASAHMMRRSGGAPPAAAGLSCVAVLAGSTLFGVAAVAAGCACQYLYSGGP